MKEKLLTIINEIRTNSGLPLVDSLEAEMDLRKDLELDSISIAELIASVDMAFNADINAKGMVETVGDIFNRV